MNGKRSVVVNDSLLAEARRLAGVRTSAAAVNAALREFVVRRNGEGAGKIGAGKKSPAKKGGRRGGAADLVALVECMREIGWDGFDYKEQRRRFGRKFDDIG